LTDQTAQVRDDALTVLADLLGWCVTPARWEEVEQVIESLGGGLDLADPDQLAALSQATFTLELAAPTRITRIDKYAVPAPDRVRERINHLIHELKRPEGLDEAAATTGAPVDQDL
jgi:hypothetical protein